MNVAKFSPKAIVAPEIFLKVFLKKNKLYNLIKK